jgi:hypothetical protein
MTGAGNSGEVASDRKRPVDAVHAAMRKRHGLG